MPRNAPRQNPVSVQAAYAMPRVSNTPGLRTVTSCVVRNGVKSQVNSWLTTSARIVIADPSSVSFAAVQRTRPMPWVQA